MDSDSTSRVISRKLEIQDLDILKVIDTLEDYILRELEVLVSREEGESFSMNVLTLQVPSEFFLSNQEFREFTESFDVRDVEMRRLLDSSMSSSSTCSRERESTEW